MTTPSSGRDQFVFGARIARAWTRLYTRGLEPDVRDRRRDELDDDLWDHQRSSRLDGMTDFSTSVALLFRTLSGIPDDMSWRSEAGAPARATITGSIAMRPSQRTTHRLATAGMLGAVFGSILTLLSVALVANQSARDWAVPTLVMAQYIASALSLLGVLALHFFQRERSGWAGRWGVRLVVLAFGMMLVTNAVQMFLPFESPLRRLVPYGNEIRAAVSIAGWMLLGVGTLRAARLPDRFVRLPLALGVLSLALFVLRIVVGRDPFAFAAALGRPAYPILYVAGAVWGIGFAAIAYGVWAGTRADTRPHAPATA